MFPTRSSYRTTFTLAASILALALSASGTDAEDPAASDQLATATFSMYCYWTGEATLGRVPGVVASRIGHLDGQEVVRVTYDPEQTDMGRLTNALKKQRSFYSLIAMSPEEEARARQHLRESDVKTSRGDAHFIASKHSLKTVHPDLYYLDLTEEQAIALNSWSYFGGPMPDVLSPEQKERHRLLRARLAQGRPSGLDPEGARSPPRLEAYRRELKAWLDR